MTIALLDGPVATGIPELRGQDVQPTASLCDRALGRPEEAAPLYRQALGKDAGDEATYARLWEILAAAGARSSLIELASHMIARATLRPNCSYT